MNYKHAAPLGLPPPLPPGGSSVAFRSLPQASKLPGVEVLTRLRADATARQAPCSRLKKKMILIFALQWTRSRPLARSPCDLRSACAEQILLVDSQSTRMPWEGFNRLG
jgi:hypothetical protein